jgi:hypothetical protein
MSFASSRALNGSIQIQVVFSILSWGLKIKKKL